MAAISSSHVESSCQRASYEFEKDTPRCGGRVPIASSSVLYFLRELATSTNEGFLGNTCLVPTNFGFEMGFGFGLGFGKALGWYFKKAKLIYIYIYIYIYKYLDHMVIWLIRQANKMMEDFP